MKSFKQLTEAGTGQIYNTKPQSSDDATNPEVLLRGYGRFRTDGETGKKRELGKYRV
jgi:hypothetical protein